MQLIQQTTQNLSNNKFKSPKFVLKEQLVAPIKGPINIKNIYIYFYSIQVKTQNSIGY